MFKGVAEIMYFVPDRTQAAHWYAQLFNTQLTYLSDPDDFLLKVGAHEIWFHQADSKAPAGAAGQVAYWQVDDFDAALERAESLGAVLYRGPLRRPDGQHMCQVRDPFGNVIGLIGPRAEQLKVGAG
jgi:predicted enzyme related to lactoylglutathione lyase